MVTDVKESDILSTVVAAGDQIDRLNGEGVALIQQIKVGDKVYLFHRTAIRKDGQISAPHRSARVTEFGQKREITVSGSYGLGKPLTICYKTAPDAKPTKLVINSISGSPWTEEEERLHQERLREQNGQPPLAPPPIKP